MDTGECLWCGGAVKQDPHRPGNKKGFCSSECRRLRRNQEERSGNKKPVRAARAVASKAAWRAANQDYFREHYARNKDRRKAEALAWYRANAERVQARVKVYAAEHPEQTRALGRKSAAKRRAIQADVFVEVVDPRVVYERDHGICGICSTAVAFESKWEVDHVVPISKGGEHAYANVQLAHRKCNRAKGAKLLTAA